MPAPSLQDLTPRQRQVLELIARGRSNTEIGQALGISKDGAKWHVSEILGRLGLSTREEAADYWRRQNGLRPRVTRVWEAVASARVLRWVGGGVAAAGAAGVAIVLLVIAAAGHDDPTPTNAATTTVPGTTATAAAATPVPIAGPLLAYWVEGETTRGVPESAEVVVHDAGTGQIVSQWEFGTDARPIDVELAGDRVVVATERRVSLHELDGTLVRVLYQLEDSEPNARVIDIAVRVPPPGDACPDGADCPASTFPKEHVVAIGTESECNTPACDAQSGRIWVLSLETGDFPVPPFIGSKPFDGVPAKLTWTADGRGVVVRGAAGRDGHGSVATIVQRPGSDVVEVNVHGGGAWIDYGPGAEYLAVHRELPILCIAAAEVAIIDRATGVERYVIAQPGRFAQLVRWSPDEQEALVTFYPEGAEPGTPDCGAEPEHHLLSLATGDLSAALADREATLRRWYQPYIELDCGDEPVSEVRGVPGEIFLQCRSQGMGTVLIDGQPSADGSAVHRLGVLEH